jgi:hypothetical protein
MVINQETYIGIGGLFIIVVVIFYWVRRLENEHGDDVDSIDEHLI